MQLREGRPPQVIRTEGNFIVLEDTGERRAAFAMESDARFFTLDRKFILPDEMFDQGWMTGAHDEADPDHQAPHAHFSIITVGDDGVVADFDWGYHSIEEAKETINGLANS